MVDRYYYLNSTVRSVHHPNYYSSISLPTFEKVTCTDLLTFIQPPRKSLSETRFSFDRDIDGIGGVGDIPQLGSVGGARSTGKETFHSTMTFLLGGSNNPRTTFAQTRIPTVAKYHSESRNLPPSLKR